MPPRPRRESPARRAQRIQKHVAQAREYWAKGNEHLLEQDICQAAEKGWGTVAQLTKAVATLRGWDHFDHVAIQECITALAEEIPSRQRDIFLGMQAAESLHGQFYEIYMTLPRVGVALETLVPLLEILWGLLPDDYTGGGTFVPQVHA